MPNIADSSGISWRVRFVKTWLARFANSDVDGPKESGSASHLVSDDDAPLAAALNLEELHDRTVAALDLPHDLLVYFEGILGRLFEEGAIRDGTDVGLSIGARRGEGRRREVTLGDKVAPQLLGCGCGDGSGGSVCL